MKNLCIIFVIFCSFSCGSSNDNPEEDSTYFDSYSYFEITPAPDSKYVPTTKYPFNDSTYMTNINTLIEQTVQSKIDSDEFIALVKAVAWTESSWGHYLKTDDKYYVLLGDSGHSFGIMQIHNAYHDEFPILEENLAYGIDLLVTAYNKATIESCSTGTNSGTTQNHVIRRTYAQYNGGPSAMCRGDDSRDDRAVTNFTTTPWKTYLSSSSLLFF